MRLYQKLVHRKIVKPKNKSYHLALQPSLKLSSLPECISSMDCVLFLAVGPTRLIVEWVASITNSNLTIGLTSPLFKITVSNESHGMCSRPESIFSSALETDVAERIDQTKPEG